MHSLLHLLEQIFILANMRLAMGVIESLELFAGLLFVFWFASFVEQHGAIFRRGWRRSKQPQSAEKQTQTTDTLLSQGIGLLRDIANQSTTSKN